jgi:hypothetical protein
LDLSTYGCIPSLVMSVLAWTKIWFHHRDKINPSVVFPSSVQPCFGPSMLSGTWILCYRLFSYLDVPVYPCTTWLPLIEILPSVGRGTTISTWLILTCLWKHISWMTTILHWMAERTLDLSTYGCIPSLVMSVLVCWRLVFFRLAGPFTTRCPGVIPCP